MRHAMSFSSELKRARTELNLTQAQLAEALSVEQTTISRWERGAEPNTESVALVASFFEEKSVPFEYLASLLEKYALKAVGKIRRYVPKAGFVHDSCNVEFIQRSDFEKLEGPPDSNDRTVCLQLKTHTLQPYFLRESLLYYDEPDDGMHVAPATFGISLSADESFVGMILPGSKPGLLTIVTPKGPFIDIPSRASAKINGSRMR